MQLKFIISTAFICLTAICANATVTEIDDIWDIKYNKRPMVIEAYASWCPPCRVYGPIIERLSREYAGKVDFYKVDVDNPDAADFIDRYEVNSVPLTVFLWDPEGDAAVEEAVERGLMSYDELKYHIELSLSKHFTNVKPKPSITDNIDYSSTAKLSSWPEPPELSVMSYYPTPEISPYLGKWVGEEDGDESIIHFWEDNGTIYCTAATNASHRLGVYSTPYWWIGAYRWENSENGIWLSDVISATPRNYSDSSQIKYGFYRDKILRIEGNTLVVTVKEYKDWSDWNNYKVSREFTCKYKKI